MRSTAWFSLIGWALLNAPLARAGVLIVDAAGGPGSFAQQIQPAVDAAADGDVILVRNGAYSGFDVSDKSLAILAEQPWFATLSSRVRVRNLQGFRTVSIRGFSLAIPPIPGFSGSEALRIENDAGKVRVEQCVARGAWGKNVGSQFPDHHPDGFPGATISNCASVAFLRCELAGGLGGDYPDLINTYLAGRGGDGVVVSGSSVVLYDCIAEGGPGGSGDSDDPVAGGDGGHAFVLTGGSLFASGTTFRGGAGNLGGWDLLFDLKGNGGDGGDGLVTQFSGFRRLGCAFAGGSGGTGPGLPGVPGQGLVQVGGTVTDLPKTPRHLAVSSPVRELGTVQLTAAGVPLEAYYLLLGAGTGHSFLPAYAGVLLASPPLTLVPLGVLDATGGASFSVPLPPLPAGLAAATAWCQYIGSAEGGVLGAASALTIFDAAF